MDIRQKIAKILEKARSTNNEAEAEMLMAKAMQLMEEHQIEARDLGDASDPIAMSVGVTAQAGPPSYRSEVQRALAEYYGCKVMQISNPSFWDKAKMKMSTQTWHLEIVGPLSARVTTELMTDFVWEELRKLAKSQSKEFDMKADIQLRKLANALIARVWKLVFEMRKAQGQVTTPTGKNALVLLDATKAAFENLYPNRITSRVGTRASNLAARAGAAGIGLHRQATGTVNLQIGR